MGAFLRIFPWDGSYEEINIRPDTCDGFVVLPDAFLGIVEDSDDFLLHFELSDIGAFERLDLFGFRLDNGFLFRWWWRRWCYRFRLVLGMQSVDKRSDNENKSERENKLLEQVHFSPPIVFRFRESICRFRFFRSSDLVDFQWREFVLLDVLGIDSENLSGSFLPLDDSHLHGTEAFVDSGDDADALVVYYADGLSDFEVFHFWEITGKVCVFVPPLPR